MATITAFIERRLALRRWARPHKDSGPGNSTVDTKWNADCCRSGTIRRCHYG